jgi:hypothetical protein
MTERARYLFAVKEYSGGATWVMFEPRKDDVTPLSRGFLGFDLVDGTSYEDAHKIADYLNEHIKEVTYTALRTRA